MTNTFPPLNTGPTSTTVYYSISPALVLITAYILTAGSKAQIAHRRRHLAISSLNVLYIA